LIKPENDQLFSLEKEQTRAKTGFWWKLKKEYLSNPNVYKSGKKKFNFNSDLYAHKKIKAALKEIQHKKCCYCESYLAHVSYGDVEHFRPKAAWKSEETDAYRRPGYYWLAYDWDNLFLACTIWNQRDKRNMFPLIDESKRALDHTYNLNDEEPILINPEKDVPEQHITFDGVHAEAKNNSIKGDKTIEILELNDDALVNNRLRYYTPIKLLINEMYPEPKEFGTNRTEIKEFLKKVISSEGEYLNMIKSNFGVAIQKILNDPI